MKDEARSTDERKEVEIKLIKCPSGLRAIAQALNRNQAKIGTFQRGGLETALHSGALLHLGKTKVKHGNWLPWLERHFDGSIRCAQKYEQMACAYAQDPAYFAGCESIERGLQVAQEVPKPTDLPPWLPGIMEPPKLRVVGDGPKEASDSAARPAGLPATSAEGAPEDGADAPGTAAQAVGAASAKPRQTKATAPAVSDEEVYVAVLEVVNAISRAKGQVHFANQPEQIRLQVAHELSEASRHAREAVRLLHQAELSRP